MQYLLENANDDICHNRDPLYFSTNFEEKYYIRRCKVKVKVSPTTGRRDGPRGSG